MIWVIAALSPSVTSTQSVCCDRVSLQKNSQTFQPGKRRFRTDGFSFSITMSLMHTCCHPSHIFLHKLNSHQTETYCTYSHYSITADSYLLLFLYGSSTLTFINTNPYNNRIIYEFDDFQLVLNQLRGHIKQNLPSCGTDQLMVIYHYHTPG